MPLHLPARHVRPPSRILPRLGRYVALLLSTAALPVQSQGISRSLLDSLRQQSPGDAIVLFHLATREAAAQRWPEAFGLLDEMAGASGGLDPSFSRAFWSQHGNPAFERIVARIKAQHPPIVRSTLAFEIAEGDLHPEGIAFDPRSRSTFIGSFKGRIVRTDSLGRTSDFATIDSDGAPRAVVGLRVDTRRGHLWAVVDDPRAFGDPAIAGGALHQYDIATGRLLSQVGGATGAFNDLVVTPDGDVYATNTTEGSLWRRSATDGRLERVTPIGSVAGLNGVANTPDGRSLFLAGWREIVRVDLPSLRATPLRSAGHLPTGSFDGLYWHEDGLVGIQNGVHPGRVVRLRLSRDLTEVTSDSILERYPPDFGGMTTAAIDGSTLLYIANTQSRRFGPDGTLLPGQRFDPIRIRRLPLR